MSGKAGRPIGARNKRTWMARRAIEEKCPGFDPLVFMAQLAGDEKEDQVLRLSAAKELVKYMYPQLKSTEITGVDGGPIDTKHTVTITFGPKPKDSNSKD